MSDIYLNDNNWNLQLIILDSTNQYLEREPIVMNTLQLWKVYRKAFCKEFEWKLTPENYQEMCYNLLRTLFVIDYFSFEHGLSWHRIDCQFVFTADTSKLWYDVMSIRHIKYLDMDWFGKPHSSRKDRCLMYLCGLHGIRWSSAIWQETHPFFFCNWCVTWKIFPIPALSYLPDTACTETIF